MAEKESSKGERDTEYKPIYQYVKNIALFVPAVIGTLDPIARNIAEQNLKSRSEEEERRAAREAKRSNCTGDARSGFAGSKRRTR